MNTRELTISFADLLDAWVTAQHLSGNFCVNGVIVTTPRDFFEGFVPTSLESVSASLPEDVVVAFYIDGEQGGSWQVHHDEGGSTVGPAGDGPKDCEMWCDSETFMRMVQGSLGSNRAFLSGRLRISGDVGLALALEGFLREAA